MPRCRSARARVMPPIPPPAIRTLRLPWGMNFLLGDFSRKMESRSGLYRLQLGKDVTMSTMKSSYLMLGLALALISSDGMAQAQTYPSRPITVIIPFAGGSASDVVSRIMLDKMSKNMGQPIIVENRPGAGGNTGTQQGAKSAPDGYTLIGGGSGPVAANLTLYKSLGYDPLKDLEMISPFAGFTIVVAVSKNLPITSLKALVEHVKANPGLNFGSVGIGSSQHLAGEYFAQVTGAKLVHVPYRNIAQYGPDLIEGRVP